MEEKGAGLERAYAQLEVGCSPDEVTEREWRRMVREGEQRREAQERRKVRLLSLSRT